MNGPCERCLVNVASVMLDGLEYPGVIEAEPANELGRLWVLTLPDETDAELLVAFPIQSERLRRLILRAGMSLYRQHLCRGPLPTRKEIEP